MKNDNYKKIAIHSAQQAGKILLQYFNKLNRSDIKAKSKHEIITPADLAAEKIILKIIKDNFPTHKILSEEEGAAGAQESDYLWVIDPLDGTTNFVMGNPLFSVSIGLFKNDKIILGVVYVPFLNNIYAAEEGKGAFLNGKKIRASKVSKIKDAFLCFCHGGNDESVKQAIAIYHKLKFEARDLRQIGSAAIECAWVAQGKTEAIMIPGVSVWDVAAGALLVREAGGIVTDMLGHEWDLNSKGIIASNKMISDKLIQIVENIH
ncbi:MAG: inositol monophosphatase family protein [Candidatus Kuenenbacteria bacterium]